MIIKKERRYENRWWRHIRIRVHQIMWDTDMYATRFMLAMSALTIGVLLLFPTKEATYRIMFDIMPQLVWATAFIIQGLVMSWSLLCNRSPRITLWLDALLGSALWTSTTIACLLTFSNDVFFTSPPISFGVEIWVAVASWWTMVRHYSEEEVK